MSVNWMQTVSGRTFYYDSPRIADISIEDIAHALSHICRFNGHTKLFYSVAEHSVNVCEYVKDPELKLQALLHDAHEAYIGDISTPMKKQVEMTSFYRLDQRMWQAIAERFKLPLELAREVSNADLQLLADEATAMWGVVTVNKWQLGVIARPFRPKFLSPQAARNAFLAEYQRWR